MSNTITVTGNATAAPELRHTAKGTAVAGFTVADNHRKKDQSGQWVDDGATFLRVNVWEHLAEACAEKIGKGTRVTVTGVLKQREYETREGEKRTVYEITAQDVSIPLPKFPPRDSSGYQQRPSAGQQPQSDPWGAAPDADDAPPF